MASGFNSSDILRVPYEHQYILPIEKGLEHEPIRDVFVTKWHYTVYIGLAYFVFVKTIEQLMKSREAYELKTVLTLWNGVLALFSILGLFRTSEEIIHTLSTHSFYHSICYTYSETSVSAYWYLYFSLSKLWELGDTVFLALRKRHLSFLHCYHHFSVLIYTFQSGAEQMAAGRWFIVMNFAAHSCMYTYYTLTSLGLKPSKRVAACVTTVQLIQMLGGVCISCIVLGLKVFTDLPCQQSWFNLVLCFSIYVSYFCLFMQFFHNSYVKPKVKQN